MKIRPKLKQALKHAFTSWPYCIPTYAGLLMVIAIAILALNS